jgi:hypothetical protein
MSKTMVVASLAIGFWACGGDPDRSAGLALCGSDARLELSLEGSYRTSLTVPPGSATAHTDEVILLLGGLGDLRIIQGDKEEVHPDRRVFRGLASAPVGSLAFTDSEVVVYLDGLWSDLDTGALLSPIRSAVADPQTGDYWFVSGESEARITRMRVGPRSAAGLSLTDVQSWDVPGNWRVLPHGNGALLVSTRRPFDMVGLSADGAHSRLGDLADSDKFPAWPDSAAPYLVSAWPLDCDRGLLTVADARSSHRALLVVGSAGGQVLRGTSIDANMGFFDAHTATERLFAFRMSEHGGEVLVYRWSWVTDDPGRNNPNGGRIP